MGSLQAELTESIVADRAEIGIDSWSVEVEMKLE